MNERSGVETGRSVEATCNNLIDLGLNARNGRDIRQITSEDVTDRSSPLVQNPPRFAELPSSKDTNNDKCIDQANLNRASLCNRGTEKEETTQSTTLERNRRKENKPEKTLTESKELLAQKTSDTGEKEEGNYEELVCLVRQFYVERPVNPAAIAHQNIETC